MKPIGPLMREHRLIERMFAVLRKKVETTSMANGFDSRFFEGVLDFFLVYVDKAHHGKEEQILFKALLTKTLTDDHRSLIGELTAEHASGRKMFNDLADVVNQAVKGNPDSKQLIAEIVHNLEALYTDHIRKEDSRFFFPVMEYLSHEEQDMMLDDMAEFDTKVLHDKYEAIVVDLENSGG